MKLVDIARGDVVPLVIIGLLVDPDPVVNPNHVRVSSERRNLPILLVGWPVDISHPSSFESKPVDFGT
jgi:hypothetical protein